MEENKEDKYWSNLERIYVHNVYEQISRKYDELLSLSQTKSHQNNCSNLDETANNLNYEENSLFRGLNANKLRHTFRSNRFKTIFNSSENGPILDRSTPNKSNLWPKVKQFLLDLEPYSLVADVGCGDGKYLNVNSKILPIGSDRSNALCHLASSKFRPARESVNNRNQILICDNLALPFRADLFDAVISIGVVHHLSAEKRRIRALKELERILKPNGKIMIYVWAMEQKIRKFNSQDVLIPMLKSDHLDDKKKNQNLNRDSSVTSVDSKQDDFNTEKLRNFENEEEHSMIFKNETFIKNLKGFLKRKFTLNRDGETCSLNNSFPLSHLSPSILLNYSEKCSTINSETNRSSSASYSASSHSLNQNLPIQNSKSSAENTEPESGVLNAENKRFYHVFRKMELDNLIKENCADLIIYDSFYDHGNWCICAKKREK